MPNIDWYRLVILPVIFTFYIQLASSQVLSGVWKGNYEKRLFNNPQKLIVNFELSSDSILTGTSYLIYKNGHYEEHKLDGIYHQNDSIITFSETLLRSTVSAYEVYYKMKLSQTDSNYTLTGSWRRKSGLSLASINKVWLIKKKQVIPHLDSIAMNLRTEIVQQHIIVKGQESDSVKYSLYDNGSIDNDTISLYLNDSCIIRNLKLSPKPFTGYLSLSADRQFHKLKLVAINLGLIPPNTALLVLETKRNQYQIKLSSSLNACGIVEFELRE